MRNVLIALVAAATPFAVIAQAPAAAPAAAAHAGHYSVEDTELGTLLDDPAAKAVLAKHIPDVIGNAQVEMARSMTLKSLQNYAGEQLTDQKLAVIQADLAKLPVEK